MLGAIILTAVLLVLGLVLRSQFRFLAAARIPASLIAGAIGLVVWQVVRWSAWAPDGSTNGTSWQRFVDLFESESITNLQAWPGWLIAVVFAGMLLSKSPSKGGPARQGARSKHAHNGNSGWFSPVAREALMVWIIVLGQTVVGLWMVWWWIGPVYKLPASAGMLIETGFAGGHGTAAAMGTVFSHPTIGLKAGLDLGVLMATSGLVYGLVSGIVWIEIGVRRGWVAADTAKSLPSDTSTPDGKPKAEDVQGHCHEIGPPVADAIDPLLLQLVWLMLAFTIGVGLQWGVDSVAQWIDDSGWIAVSSGGGIVGHSGNGGSEAGDAALRDRLRVAGIVGSFPLFIYTLFGGVIVRFCILKTVGGRWIDHDTISRLVGTSMDLLVVAAVVTLNLAVVASLWVPMAGLFLGGAIWSTFCLLVLSRKILPESHWFELGLINFGMSTGTTATGFVLLRVIDPDLKTRAAEQYALAAPLSAPFIGGGMITIGLPLLLLERVPVGMSAVGMTVVLALLIVWGVSWKTKCYDEGIRKTRRGH